MMLLENVPSETEEAGFCCGCRSFEPQVSCSEGGVSTSVRESLTKFVGSCGKKVGVLSKKPGILRKLLEVPSFFLGGSRKKLGTSAFLLEVSSFFLEPPRKKLGVSSNFLENSRLFAQSSGLFTGDADKFCQRLARGGRNPALRTV
jgi:hypothetical protein